MSTAWRDYSKKLLSEPDLRGRLVESSVGAYLLNLSGVERFELRWWREGDDEVDFVVRRGEKLAAVEVKSGRVKSLGGLAAFAARYPEAHPLVIGGDANPLEDFLRGKIPLFG